MKIYQAPAANGRIKLLADRETWQRVIDTLSPNRRLADPLTVTIMDVLTHATDDMIPVSLDRESAKTVIALSQRL